MTIGVLSEIVSIALQSQSRDVQAVLRIQRVASHFTRTESKQRQQQHYIQNVYIASTTLLTHSNLQPMPIPRRPNVFDFPLSLQFYNLDM